MIVNGMFAGMVFAIEGRYRLWNDRCNSSGDYQIGLGLLLSGWKLRVEMGQ